MSARDETNFHLPAEAMEALTTVPAGKLAPCLDPPGRPLPFVLLDCFDQSLRRSGRLLIEAGDRLELLTADGRILTQAARRKGGFVADLAEGPVKAALADLSPLRALLPLGTGEMRPATLSLVDDEGKTRARALLRLLTGTGGKETVVATLSGLRGYDKALDRLRAHLVACGGLGLAEGGLYRRLFVGHRPYQPKPAIAIGRKDRAIDVASDIIAAHIPVARANEPGIIADLDSEFLHDYRIALRKIRSVLSLFKGVYDPAQTDALKARFAALMAPTGRLRDLDVYLLERHRYEALLPEAMHGGLDRMFALFRQERHAAQAQLADHLRGTAYRAEIADLARLFETRKALRPGPNAARGAHDLACELIWKRYRKICRIAAELGPETPDGDIHALRIHCKKLRYLMEFFAPAFSEGRFAELIKPLKRLQDRLGLFNDFSVQQVSLRAFLAGLDKVPEAERLEIAQSAGALIMVLHQRQLEERDKVAGSFARFNSAKTQRLFRDLFRDGGEGT